MNQEQLNAIKECVAKATPGPWESGQIDGKRSFCVIDKDSFVAKNMTRKDSEFVAHAREDVPALVEYIESLHELRKDDFLVMCESKDEVRKMRLKVERLQKALEQVMEVEAPIMEGAEGWETRSYEIARQALGGEAHE
ncbi:hypothetical protein [Lysinibacillus sphaericus]|nr:hypothetical protein [Lysinibacillus sphaericus]